MNASTYLATLADVHNAAARSRNPIDRGRAANKIHELAEKVELALAASLVTRSDLPQTDAQRKVAWYTANESLPVELRAGS